MRHRWWRRNSTYFEIDIDVQHDHFGALTNLGWYDIHAEDAAGNATHNAHVFEILAPGAPPIPPVPPILPIEILGITPATLPQDAGVQTLQVTGRNLNLIAPASLQFAFNTAPALLPLYIVRAMYNITATSFEIDVDPHPNTPGLYDIHVDDGAGNAVDHANFFTVLPPGIVPPPHPPITPPPPPLPGTHPHVTRVVPHSARSDQGTIVLRVEGTHLDTVTGANFLLHASRNPYRLTVQSPFNIHPDHFDVEVDVSLDCFNQPTALGMYDVGVLDAYGRYRTPNLFEILPAGGQPLPPPPIAITITRVLPEAAAQDLGGGSGNIILQVEGTHLDYIYPPSLRFPYHLDPSLPPIRLRGPMRDLVPTRFEIPVNVLHNALGSYDIHVEDSAGHPTDKSNVFVVLPGAVPIPPLGKMSVTRIVPDRAQQHEGLVDLQVEGHNIQLVNRISLSYHATSEVQLLEIIGGIRNASATSFNITVNVRTYADGTTTKLGKYDIYIGDTTRSTADRFKAFTILPGLGPVPPPLPPPRESVVEITSVTPSSARQDSGISTLTIEGKNLKLLSAIRFPFARDPTKPPLNKGVIFDNDGASLKVSINVSVDEHNHMTELGEYSLTALDKTGKTITKDNVFTILPPKKPARLVVKILDKATGRYLQSILTIELAGKSADYTVNSGIMELNPVGTYKLVSTPTDERFEPLKKAVALKEEEEKTIFFYHQEKDDWGGSGKAKKGRLGFLLEIADFMEKELLPQLRHQLYLQEHDPQAMNIEESRRLIRSLKLRLNNALIFAESAFKSIPLQNQEEREQVVKAIRLIYNFRKVLDTRKDRYEGYLGLNMDKAIDQFEKFSRGIHHPGGVIHRLMEALKIRREVGEVVVKEGVDPELTKPLFPGKAKEYFDKERARFQYSQGEKIPFGKIRRRVQGVRDMNPKSRLLKKLQKLQK